MGLPGCVTCVFHLIYQPYTVKTHIFKTFMNQLNTTIYNKFPVPATWCCKDLVIKIKNLSVSQTSNCHEVALINYIH